MGGWRDIWKDAQNAYQRERARTLIASGRVPSDQREKVLALLDTPDKRGGLNVYVLKTLGISPREVEDYERIALYLIDHYLDADAELKSDLRAFVSVFAKQEYNSPQSYYFGVHFPLVFVQWRADQLGRPVGYRDFSREKDRPMMMSKSRAEEFAAAYSTEKSIHRQTIPKVVKFGRFLEDRHADFIYPFGDLKTPRKTPRGEEETLEGCVYSPAVLDGIFGTFLQNLDAPLRLFLRLLLQTGLRPLHAYILQCDDLELEEPIRDVLDRPFYRIRARRALLRYKKARDHEIVGKNAPQYVYIDQGLRDRLVVHCRKQAAAGDPYLFMNLFVPQALRTRIKERRGSARYTDELPFKIAEHPTEDLKPGEVWVKPYGMRHTWTSVHYTLVRDPKVLMELGGWETSDIPVDVYTKLMSRADALKIARKWGIYLPADTPEREYGYKAAIETMEGKYGALVSTEVEQAVAAGVAKYKAELEDVRNQLRLTRETLERLVGSR